MFLKKCSDQCWFNVRCHLHRLKEANTIQNIQPNHEFTQSPIPKRLESMQILQSSQIAICNMVLVLECSRSQGTRRSAAPVVLETYGERTKHEFRLPVLGSMNLELWTRHDCGCRLTNTRHPQCNTTGTIQMIIFCRMRDTKQRHIGMNCCFRHIGGIHPC